MIEQIPTLTPDVALHVLGLDLSVLNAPQLAQVLAAFVRHVEKERLKLRTCAPNGVKDVRMSGEVVEVGELVESSDVQGPLPVEKPLVAFCNNLDGLGHPIIMEIRQLGKMPQQARAAVHGDADAVGQVNADQIEAAAVVFTQAAERLQTRVGDVRVADAELLQVWAIGSQLEEHEIVALASEGEVREGGEPRQPRSEDGLAPRVDVAEEAAGVEQRVQVKPLQRGLQEPVDGSDDPAVLPVLVHGGSLGSEHVRNDDLEDGAGESTKQTDDVVGVNVLRLDATCRLLLDFGACPGADAGEGDQREVLQPTDGLQSGHGATYVGTRNLLISTYYK